MKQLLKKVKQISMLLLVISFTGCENDDDIYPEVISSFTHTINADTGTVTFINTSVNSRNYFWTFGDGTSSTEINPIKTYTTGEYKVTLKATNVAGASDTSEDIIVISDAGAPIITLLGDTTINITVGGTFTDPGATATDEVDGDITSNIVVAGDAVDVNTAGTYIITYNVSDAAGNAATQRTRTVIVAEVALTCPETLLALPIDFDCDGIDYESKRVAGGIDFSIIDNPQLNGANATASKVGVIVNKGDNWENLNFNLDTPIDFTTNKSIKVKLYSTVSVPIKLKLETGGTPVENDQNHTGTGWEELTFTFTTSASFSNIIVFIDGPGNTAGTFYIDDIKQVASTPPPTGCTTTLLALPINFDCASINYESKRIAGGIDFSIVDNPQLNGANATASKVGKIVNKGDNWENLNFKLDTPINFTTNKSIKLKLYSTVSVPIKLKVETGGTPVENDQTHGGTGWEVLTFTLATSASFSNIIVFIDGPGNTAGTFYIDDIEQVDGGGGTVGDCPAPPAGELLSNGDFEAGDLCWQLFAGTSISTTVNNGGSKSAEIQGVTGAAVGIKQERFAVGVLLPNTQYTVSFDIIASGAFGEGGVFKAFTFSEGADGGTVPATQHILADGVTSLATTWDTKTYTFTTAANANQVEGGLSFYMEIVNSAVKLNVDNVVIKKTP